MSEHLRVVDRNFQFSTQGHLSPGGPCGSSGREADIQGRISRRSRRRKGRWWKVQKKIRRLGGSGGNGSSGALEGLLEVVVQGIRRLFRGTILPFC